MPPLRASLSRWSTVPTSGSITPTSTISSMERSWCWIAPSIRSTSTISPPVSRRASRKSPRSLRISCPMPISRSAPARLSSCRAYWRGRKERWTLPAPRRRWVIVRASTSAPGLPPPSKRSGRNVPKRRGKLPTPSQIPATAPMRGSRGWRWASKRRPHNAAVATQGRPVGTAGGRAARVADHVRDLLGGFEALQQRGRPAQREHLLLELLDRRALRFGAPGEVRLQLFDPGWARHHRVHGDIGSLGQFGAAARHRKLRGFRETVVDHFFGDEDGRFAGDEDHASPVALEHPWQIVPGHADAAHDVHVKHLLPFGIADLGELADVIDAGVVDENVDLTDGGDHSVAAFRGAEVARRAFDARLRPFGAQLGDRRVHRVLGAAIDNHGGAHFRKATRGRVTDATRRSRDQRAFSSQIQIHQLTPRDLTLAVTAPECHGPSLGDGAPAYRSFEQERLRRCLVGRQPLRRVVRLEHGLV